MKDSKAYKKVYKDFLLPYFIKELNNNHMENKQMDVSTIKVTATSFAIAYILTTPGSFGYRIGSLIMITAVAAIIALVVSNFVE